MVPFEGKEKELYGLQRASGEAVEKGKISFPFQK
jgi:hypothetical protein